MLLLNGYQNLQTLKMVKLLRTVNVECFIFFIHDMAYPPDSWNSTRKRGRKDVRHVGWYGVSGVIECILPDMAWWWL